MAKIKKPKKDNKTFIFFLQHNAKTYGIIFFDLDLIGLKRIPNGEIENQIFSSPFSLI